MSTIHEDFGREVHGRGPSYRNFGFVFTAAFLIFGLVPLRHGKPMRLWFLALSGTIFLVTLIRPSLFHLANRIWSGFGRLLGKVVNPIITGFVVLPGVHPLRRGSSLDGQRLAGCQTRSGSQDLLDSA
jgi:hypothetical protein